MVVTMEPCSTTGRTGSCCEHIIGSVGIRRVVIGVLDPNPAHTGRAIDVLGSQGIETIWGVEQASCQALNPRYNRRMLELAGRL